MEALVIDEVSSATVEQVHRARHPKAAARQRRGVMHMHAGVVTVCIVSVSGKPVSCQYKAAARPHCRRQAVA